MLECTRSAAITYNALRSVSFLHLPTRTKQGAICRICRIIFLFAGPGFFGYVPLAAWHVAPLLVVKGERLVKRRNRHGGPFLFVSFKLAVNAFFRSSMHSLCT